MTAGGRERGDCSDSRQTRSIRGMDPQSLIMDAARPRRIPKRTAAFDATAPGKVPASMSVRASGCVPGTPPGTSIPRIRRATAGPLAVACLVLLSVIACTAAAVAQPANAPGEVRLLGAVRTSQALAVDGRLTEEAWEAAETVTGFWQRDPQEGAPATERTEVRVLYDAEAIYIGLRMFDGDAARITRRLSRRDESADADHVIVYLDPRHDHLTGAAFELTAAGVQSDRSLYDDTRSDGAWDAVWAGRVSIDDQGWSAEMRIPYSQLRFPSIGKHIWGFNVQRVIRRKNEAAWLVLTPKKERGVVSRMAHLAGLDGITPKAHLELLPYGVARAEFIRPEAPNDPFNDGSRAFGASGLDLKWGLSSSFTLDATVNPDFGQVELDPAVINLTAFETFFDEKRPFFTEGAQIFRNFGQLGGGGGESPDLFYSRRIGRAPQGSAAGDFVGRPTSTTILGAGKLTGKTHNGWSVGLLNAVTAPERARVKREGEAESRVEIEPPTNYLVGRVLKEAGQGGFGLLSTAVVRALDDPALEARLAGRSVVAGADAYYFFDAGREWLLSGQLSASRVQGSAGAMERLQRASSRYFQRPDAPRLDPARTSLSGWSGNASVGRESGAVRVEASAYAVSPGFEVNDLGYLTRSDRVGAELSATWEKFEPDRFTRNREFSMSREWEWNFARQGQGGDWYVGAEMEFLNYWDADLSVRRETSGLDDRLTRGGPMAGRPAGWDVSFDGGTDSRKPVSLDIELAREWNDAGGRETQFELSLNLKVSDRLTISTGPEFARGRDVAQYITSRADPHAAATLGRRYIFGEIEQTELSMQTRVNLLLTPAMSLQLYVQPLLGAGRYARLKEFARPEAFDFLAYGGEVGTLAYDVGEGEYRIDPDGAGPAAPFTVENPDFNEKSLHLQTVFRWEWRPGSTLYLVWTQAREHESAIGRFDLGPDARRLFRAPADDVFAIKVSYWIGR